MKPPNFVYTATWEGGPVKVGMSRWPENRLKSLQGNSPHEIRMLEIWRRANGDARSVEIMAHRILGPSRTYGEWFNVSGQEAKEAVDTAILIVETGNMHYLPGYTEAVEEAAMYAKMRPLPDPDDLSGLLEYWVEEHPDELRDMIAQWKRKRAKLRVKRGVICNAQF